MGRHSERCVRRAGCLVLFDLYKLSHPNADYSCSALEWVGRIKRYAAPGMGTVPCGTYYKLKCVVCALLSDTSCNQPHGQSDNDNE